VKPLRVWLSVALMIVGAGCGGGGPEEPNPVLLVAVDGVEWDVVLPMLREGRLPNLEKLMARGQYGKLESFRPTSSPIIWTSIGTGKTPDNHGILGFVTPEEDELPGRLYTNLDRKTKAIWNITTDEGRSAAVIGWWLTFPVEEIDGIMVAQTNTLPEDADDEDVDVDKFWKGSLLEDLDGQVHPPELQDEILSVVPRVDAGMAELTHNIFGDLPETFDPVAGQLWEACRWSLRADEVYRRVALDLLRRDEKFDFFTVYFGAPDVLGHRFWRYLFPEMYRHPPTAEQVRDYGHLIPDYYAHMDRVLGELLEAAPSNVNVLVVSDHGMSASRKEKQFDGDSAVKMLRSGGHRQAPPGIFVAAGPDVRPGTGEVPLDGSIADDLPTVGTMLDVTPTLLAMMGLPLGRDMDGVVMEGVTDATAVGWVESHTPDGWFEARVGSLETPMSEERLEQLRSLGYLGGADDD